ncbi:MAG: gliding motility-associated C-terminal domain-containing protein [Bacteroidota bacterium]|nr:gliding motility-associated C-terminal domain-containing protein [Bacteroidota bacterium]
MRIFILSFFIASSLICYGQSIYQKKNPVSADVKTFNLPNSCMITVNAGPDITICSGQGKTLNGVVTRSTDYKWEPPDGLSNPTILNPVANPTSTTTYTLTAKGTSNNLIVNGNFENGSLPPSTSSYTQVFDANALVANSSGSFAILSVPQIAIALGCNPNIGSFAMAIHGSPGVGTNFWCQTIPVTQNTEYKISFKVIGILYFFSPAPVIVCKVNGTTIGTVVAPNSLCGEEIGDFTWNSGSNTTAALCFSNATTAGLGNLCAIDEISMKECCEEKDEVRVEVYELNAEINPADDINCDNSPMVLDASSSTQGPGITYEWTTTNGRIVSGEKTTRVLIDSPGIYTFKIKGAFGCEKQLSITVNGSVTKPALRLMKRDFICGRKFGFIDVSTSANGPLYEWNGPNGYFSSQNTDNQLVDPGEYIVKVTDAFGCMSTGTLNLLDLRRDADVKIKGDTLLCNEDSIQLTGSSISLKPNFSWKGPNGIRSDTNFVFAKDSGWYYLTVVDSFACEGLDSFYVINYKANVPINISADTLDCDNNTIQITTQADTSGMFLWTGPNNFSSSNPQPTVTDSGWYYITLNTLDGCSGKDSIYVVKSADAPFGAIQANFDTLTCDISSIQLRVTSTTNDVKFDWNGPGGFITSDSLITVQDSGEYFVILNAPNGCLNIYNYKIYSNKEKPILNLTPDTLNCKKNTATLNAGTQNHRSITWLGPNGFNSTDSTPTINLGGAYNVVVFGENGCFSTGIVEILTDTATPLIAILYDTITCFNPVIIPRVTTDLNIASYIWTGPNNFSSPEKEPLIQQPGDYTLTVIGINGCQSSKQIRIHENKFSPSFVLFADTIRCNFSAQIRVNNFSNVTSFQWTGPNNFSSNLDSIQINFPGWYVLTALAKNGCSRTDSVFVFQKDQLPDIFAFDDTLSCSSPRKILRAGSQTLGVLYEWTGPNGFTSQIANPEVLEGGEYILKITDANGCVSVKKITVSDFSKKPSLSINGSDSLTCLQTNVQLSFTTDQPGQTISWRGPNGFQSSDSIIQVNEAGIYLLTIRNAFDCFSFDTILLNSYQQLPDIQVADDQITCVKRTLSLNLLSSENNLVYIWSGPNNFVSTEKNPVITNSGIYIVKATNSFGCETQKQITIAIDTVVPDLVLIADTLTCLRTSAPIIGFTKVQGVQFSWTGPNGFTSTIPQFAVRVPGIYTCSVRNPRNGCVVTRSVEVFRDTNQIQNAIITIKNDVCELNIGSVCVCDIIGGTGPLQFSIDSGNTFQSLSQFNNLSAGKYPILIKDRNGCSFFQSIEIKDLGQFNIQPLPDLELSLLDQRKLTVITDLNPGVIKSIFWQPSDQLSCSDCLNPELTASHNDEIVLTITDTNGCMRSITFRVTIKKDVNIHVPNVFSPNGDAVNDYFFPYSNEQANILLFQVFDRWGELVFENKHFKSNEELQGWNGEFRNQKVLPGVYAYLIDASVEGVSKKIVGSITLLR